MAEESDKVGFITYYRGLDESEKEEGTELYRIFDRGEFYATYGVNAERLAESFFHSNSFIKRLGGETDPLSVVYISKARFAAALRHILTVLKIGVRLYTRPSNSSRDSVNWSVYCKASVGDMSAVAHLLPNVESSVTAVVVMENTEQGYLVCVSAYDSVQLTLQSVAYTDAGSLTTLQSIVLQLQVSELVVIGLDEESLKTIQNLSFDCGMQIAASNPSFPKLSTSNLENIRPFLESEVQTNIDENSQPRLWQSYTENPSTGVSLIYLLGIRSLSPGSTFSAFTPNEYVQLDSTATTTQSMFPQPTDSNKQMCLQGLLDTCKTKGGSRLLAEWLRKPLRSIPDINKRQDIVDTILHNTGLTHNFQAALRNVPDIDGVLRKYSKQKDTSDVETSIKDQVNQRLVYLASVQVSKVGLESSDCSPLQEQCILLQTQQTQVEEVMSLIEASVDMAALDKHEYQLLPGSCDGLEELAAQRGKAERGMQRVLTEKSGEWDQEKVKLEKNGVFGWFFRVSRKDETKLRKANVEYLETRKDGVKFTIPALRSLSELHRSIQREYNVQSKEAVSELVKKAQSVREPMQKMVACLYQVDVLTAFAVAALTAFPRYKRPTLCESGSLELVQLRHPCLEAQPGVQIIPNDCVFTDSEYLQLVTGPNMGGKSTYIRAVGVCVLLAHIGCFVPCSSAKVPVLDAILSRVGAGDDQTQGVSTFMKEMLEASTILKTATPQSLVIIDELGRGTSTNDGFGLAWAIAENLAQTKAKSLFATHFHELSALDKSVPGVTNRQVTAKTTESSITMLYKLEPGSCDKSYGIHAAELTNFPKQVLNTAKEKMRKLEEGGKEAAVISYITETNTKKKQKIDDMKEQDVEKLIQLQYSAESIEKAKDLLCQYDQNG